MPGRYPRSSILRLLLARARLPRPDQPGGAVVTGIELEDDADEQTKASRSKLLKKSATRLRALQFAHAFGAAGSAGPDRLGDASVWPAADVDTRQAPWKLRRVVAEDRSAAAAPASAGRDNSGG